MRILMLGNSLTSAQDMPDILAELTGAEVVCHTRGGARLSEHLNPNTRLGARTQAALAKEQWDYVVLQEMSHGPITAPGSFFASVERLCRQIRENGAIPVLYATWAYQKGGARLSAKGWDYGGMARNLSAAYRRGGRKPRPLPTAAVLPAARHAGSLRRRWRPPQRAGGPHCGGDHSGGDSTTQGGPIMIRDICKDQAFLAQKAEPAFPEDLPVAADLLETLEVHRDGCVGMAANMIGVNKRIIAFDNQGGYMVMFNPEIVEGPAYARRRGCSSSAPQSLEWWSPSTGPLLAERKSRSGSRPSPLMASDYPARDSLHRRAII